MSASSPILSVKDLHRNFGAFKAVDGISFDVEPGQVVGFIGANGAGKTTTMRVMATLDQPTSGQVLFEGENIVAYPDRVRPNIGWMPDAFGNYDNMTVWEYLDFYARAYGLKGAARTQRIDEVMAFTDLADIAERIMSSLSKGMAQRLCLGRTLLSDPSFMILDEPAAGLDPKARMEFKNLVRLLSKKGKTIFISSHILSELDEMCDTLLFIDKGRIVHHGDTELLKRQHETIMAVNVEIANDPQMLYDWAEQQQHIQIIDKHKRGGRLSIDADEPTELAAHLARMLRDGLQVIEFHRETRRLEEAFIDILREGQGPGSAPPSETPPPSPEEPTS